MKGELDKVCSCFVSTCTSTSTMTISLAKETASVHMPDGMSTQSYRVQHDGDRHAHSRSVSGDIGKMYSELCRM
jgi:hypothetical protein